MQGVRGIVEEIGLSYTWIRTPSGDRLVVPNEKLASDTIRNSTIRSRETLVEVTVQVPARPTYETLLESLRADGDEALVTDLKDGNATIVVRRWVDGTARPNRWRATCGSSSRQRLEAGVMTRRRRSDDLSFILGQRGRKRKRSARIRRRRRAGADRRHAR